MGTSVENISISRGGIPRNRVHAGSSRVCFRSLCTLVAGFAICTLLSTSTCTVYTATGALLYYNRCLLLTHVYTQGQTTISRQQHLLVVMRCDSVPLQSLAQNVPELTDAVILLLYSSAIRALSLCLHARPLWPHDLDWFIVVVLLIPLMPRSCTTVLISNIIYHC